MYERVKKDTYEFLDKRERRIRAQRTEVAYIYMYISYPCEDTFPLEKDISQNHNEKILSCRNVASVIHVATYSEYKIHEPFVPRETRISFRDLAKKYRDSRGITARESRLELYDGDISPGTLLFFSFPRGRGGNNFLPFRSRWGSRMKYFRNKYLSRRAVTRAVIEAALEAEIRIAYTTCAPFPCSTEDLDPGNSAEFCAAAHPREYMKLTLCFPTRKVAETLGAERGRASDPVLEFKSNRLVPTAPDSSDSIRRQM